MKKKISTHLLKEFNDLILNLLKVILRGTTSSNVCKSFFI